MEGLKKEYADFRNVSCSKEMEDLKKEYADLVNLELLPIEKRLRVWRRRVLFYKCWLH